MKGYFFSHHSIKFLTIALVMISMFSCKSSSRLINKGIPPQRNKEEVVKALATRNIAFTWFSARADARLESPEESGSGSLNLRIKKDSLVWLMGKKFSIEGFRSVINKDSFFLINRLKKYFNAESNVELTRSFGLELNFDDLQNLLAGNIFLPQDDEITAYSQKGSLCTIDASVGNWKIRYLIDAYSLYLTGVTITDGSQRVIEVNLGNYKKHKKLPLMAYDRHYIFHNSPAEAVTLQLKIEEVEVDVVKSLNFDIPLHYDRLRI
ncbi:MAG: DUF4292 domain-containing protein [Saprospiraceae bacterium]|nr:DUF4292 domain-containing protein [Saprospiraceae bacterium]